MRKKSAQELQQESYKFKTKNKKKAKTYFDYIKKLPASEQNIAKERFNARKEYA